MGNCRFSLTDGKAKIGHLGRDVLPIGEQKNVLRLDVTMYDAMLMDMGKAHRRFLEESGRQATASAHQVFVRQSIRRNGITVSFSLDE